MAKCGKLVQLMPMVYHSKRDAQKKVRSHRGSGGILDHFACARVRKIKYRDGAVRWGIFVGGRR